MGSVAEVGGCSGVLLSVWKYCNFQELQIDRGNLPSFGPSIYVLLKHVAVKIGAGQ